MPLSCDKEILNIFVLELIEPLKEYRKAKKREPKKDAIVLNNNITQVISPIKEIEDAKYHGNSITFSSVDYWKSIVKSKIEVMRHFGGCDLGRLICAELAKHPDELEYKLSSAFEYLAQHVIEGWYM